MRTRTYVAAMFSFIILAVFTPRSAAAQQSITCASDNMRRNYCRVDTRGGVRLARQRSDARCQQGYSWGYDRGGIWVDRGCRADFLVTGDRPGPSYGPRPGAGRPPGGQSITCSSDDMRRHYCAADTRRGVRLVNQRSSARCTQGYSWGFDRRGIWVDRGCRADFLVR
jgi:hypothetical protein